MAHSFALTLMTRATLSRRKSSARLSWNWTTTSPKAAIAGIIFHVTDEGGAVWATGPEFQLEDNAAAKDPQRCGWLYALYQPPDDPEYWQAA
jgi:hypothetical protein